MELNDYLTVEEKEQMEGLMKKAAERRKKSKGGAGEEMSFLYVQCQYESRKEADEETDKKRADFDAELRSLMNQVCGFCQRHGYCGICSRYKEDEKIDEGLPFG